MSETQEIEDVEGLDEAASDGWGDYPLDSVFVRSEMRTVGEVVKRINNKRYVLDPDFQREFVWSIAKQSKLMESCIMRIPLPVFYVAEAKDGRIVVVDGLQRLTSLQRYIDGQYRLSGLVSEGSPRKDHALEGKLFSQLSITLQERILDTQLTMYILDAKAPERARLDIFERVNSGEPLTRQQMRNALYNGPATEWLRDAADSEAFKVATGGRLNTKTMRDREAINRFCAFFLLGPESYTTGDMDLFLAEGLTKLAKTTQNERVLLREVFDSSMRLNSALFKEHAFRKSLFINKRSANRSVINISLFEVCAAVIAPISSKALGDERMQHEIAEKILSLAGNYDFMKAITYSTNSTSAVRERFSSLRSNLAHLLP
jgi:Protein of unknown function DUF262